MTRHRLGVSERDRVRDAGRHADRGLTERTRVVLIEPINDPENVQWRFKREHLGIAD